MAISKDEVKKIAVLARISLTEEEIERYSEDLSRILEYAESIQEIETSDIAPTSHIINIENVMRDDNICESLLRTEVLSQAPESDESCFIAPKII